MSDTRTRPARGRSQAKNLKVLRDEIDPYSYRMGDTKKGSSRPSHPVFQGEPGRLDPRVYADTWEEGLPPVGLGYASEAFIDPIVNFFRRGGDPYTNLPRNSVDIHALREAIRKAETGGISNPWIRTMAPEAGSPGSSAYGPGQIIAGPNLTDLIKRNPNYFSGLDPNYVNILNNQRDMFLKYGREPNKPGYEKRWDYGGTGDPAAQNPDQYNIVWSGFIQSKIAEALGYMPQGRDLTKEEMEKVVGAYRGQPRSVDPRYYDVIDKNYWP